MRGGVLTLLNSPHPSPLPVRRGEGEAAASGAGTSLTQRQWGNALGSPAQNRMSAEGAIHPLL